MSGRPLDGAPQDASQCVRPPRVGGVIQMLVGIIEQRHLAYAKLGGRGAQLRRPPVPERYCTGMPLIPAPIPPKAPALAACRGDEEHVHAVGGTLRERATHSQ